MHIDAGARTHKQNGVNNKSPTSSHPKHRRITPGSGVDMTSFKTCRHFDEHAFEHTFHGFPSPLQFPSAAERSSTSRYTAATFSSRYVRNDWIVCPREFEAQTCVMPFLSWRRISFCSCTILVTHCLDLRLVSQCIISPRPLVSTQLCLLLPSPSSSSWTLKPVCHAGSFGCSLCQITLASCSRYLSWRQSSDVAQHYFSAFIRARAWCLFFFWTALIRTVAYSLYCNSLEWFWWDWSLSRWPTGCLQCFDAVSWVIWPVKIVPKMTYKVSSGTLNLYSLTVMQNDVFRLS